MDPRWGISFMQQGEGWTWEEIASNLTVTDVFDTEASSTLGQPWGVVRMSQSVAPLGDFAAHMQFSWDSAGTNAAMQRLILRLQDDEGAGIATAVYHDNLIAGTGTGIFGIEGQGTHLGAGALELAGSATVDITRVGDVVTILWDGQEVFSGESSRVLSKVRLEFWHYGYERNGVTSVFGTESVDVLTIAGTIVPSPAGLAVIGLLALAGRRRR